MAHNNETSDSAGLQLKKCENPWKPNMHHGQSEVYRRMLGILNRVTFNSLPTFLEQALELPLLEPNHLPSILSLLLSKSEDEPLFARTYALLCAEISNNVALKDPLASVCWSHFTESLGQLRAYEDVLKDPVTMDVIQEEILARKRLTVHISFVCELERKGIVSSTQIENMAETLLSHGDLRSLECLCRLVNFQGPKLNEDLVERSCTRLHELIMSDTLQPRLRFLFQGSLELRANHWRPRQRSTSQARNSRG